MGGEIKPARLSELKRGEAQRGERAKAVEADTAPRMEGRRVVAKRREERINEGTESNLKKRTPKL